MCPEWRRSVLVFGKWINFAHEGVRAEIIRLFKVYLEKVGVSSTCQLWGGDSMGNRILNFL